MRMLMLVFMLTIVIVVVLVMMLVICVFGMHVSHQLKKEWNVKESWVDCYLHTVSAHAKQTPV